MSITVTQRFASTDTAPFVTVHPPQAERTCVKSDDALTQEAFDPSDIQADQKWALDSGSNKVVGDDVEWSFTLEDTTDATPLDSSKAWVVAFWTTTGEPVSTRTISPQTAGVSEPVYLVEGLVQGFADEVITSTSTGLVQTSGEYDGCDLMIATTAQGRIRRTIVSHTYNAGTHTFTLNATPDDTVEGQSFWILPSASGAILEDTGQTLPASLAASSPVLQYDVDSDMIFEMPSRKSGVIEAVRPIYLTSATEKPRFAFNTKTFSRSKPYVITSVEVLDSQGAASAALTVADDGDLVNCGVRDFLILSKVTAITPGSETYTVRITYTALDSSTFVVQGNIVVP